MVASTLVFVLAGLGIFAEWNLVAAQTPPTDTIPACEAIAITPDADLRPWLADPERPFQAALQNDLPSCIKDAGSSPYGILTDIMTKCTDRYVYASPLDPANTGSITADSAPNFKLSSTQSHPSCGCDPGCKTLLSSITPECWQKMFEVFCAYDIRSVTVGASLASVYTQLTSRGCYAQASSSSPLTCDDLALRQDPRNDIRINDVANDSTGLKAVMWASVAACLLSLAIIL